MNNQKLNAYIQLYKDHFEEVSQKELYKWRAVRHFQEYWDIDAANFSDMAKNALGKVKNLMDAGKYFPRRMLLRNAEQSPEQVRQLFKNLFNEHEDIINRIESFEQQFTILNEQNFGNKKHYQDHRAIIVYLTLKFPERYFFYKFGMLKAFTKAIDYEYKPIKGRIENIGQFQSLCKIVRHELAIDDDLILLHQQRLSQNCYSDTKLNLLTQDFIYAVVKHLPNIEEVVDQVNEVIDIDIIDANQIIVATPNFNFEPFTTNHIENNQENKRVGDLGELWIMDYERKKLFDLNLPRLAKKVKHHAKDIGDGLGYDILSFDELGNEMLIEVKTTKGKLNTPYFITANELARSVVDSHKYFLYRVYDFNEKRKSGSIKIIRGQLNTLCTHPINYRVKMI